MRDGLTGTDIPEYSFVAPDDGRVLADWDGTKVEAAVFNDLLEPAGEQAEVLARYASSYYAGTPALIRNRYGKGEAYFFVLNYAPESVKVEVKKELRELFAGELIKGEAELGAYEVKIFAE